MSELGSPIDDRTEYADLQLPHPNNWQEDDVLRMRAAFSALDALLQLMYTDIDALDNLLGSTTLGRQLLKISNAQAARTAIGAGTSSFDGSFGALTGKPPALADHGVADVVNNATLGNVSLNSVLVSGFYRFGAAPTNGPSGVANSLLLVSRGGDSVSQIIVQASTGNMWTRGASNVPAAPAWSVWKRVANHVEPPIALAGAAISLSAGNSFSESVNGARTLQITGGTAGCSFCLEITHLSGVITWPGSTVWPGGTAPQLTTSRRHLVFFQMSSNGASWFASILKDFPL